MSIRNKKRKIQTFDQNVCEVPPYLYGGTHGLHGHQTLVRPKSLSLATKSGQSSMAALTPLADGLHRTIVLFGSQTVSSLPSRYPALRAAVLMA